MDTPPDTPAEPPRPAVSDVVDPTRPHPARRYDYWLGGKTNFAADRASAEAIAARFPTVRRAALANRDWTRRVVTWLSEQGVGQFLDIGTGIPTPPHVHQLAQELNPAAGVVYVDNDPVVLVHARALMTSPIPGTTAYIQADLRDPKSILTDPALHATLDLEQPVALILGAVLHFLDDTDDPYGVVRHLLQALPPGSYLAISQFTFDPLAAEMVERLTPMLDPSAGHGTFRPRTYAEVARFFDGLDIVEPGLGSVVHWRPTEPPAAGAEQDVAVYGAVAIKP